MACVPAGVRTRRQQRLRKKQVVRTTMCVCRCAWPVVCCRCSPTRQFARTSSAMTRQRDDHWTSDLASEDAVLRNDAVSDLRDMLFRGLSKSLSKHGRVNDAFLEDIVQEASMRILEKLGDFEGRSKFRTWAVTIAVRTAVSKMRNREWRNVSLESFTSHAEFDSQIAVDSSETTVRTNSRLDMLEKLKELIDSELTVRQWIAITAELRG